MLPGFWHVIFVPSLLLLKKLIWELSLLVKILAQLAGPLPGGCAQAAAGCSSDLRRSLPAMEGAHEQERDENLRPQDTPARLPAPHAKQASGDSEQTPPVRPLQLHNAATVRQALTIRETMFPFAPEQLQVFLRPALRVT